MIITCVCRCTPPFPAFPKKKGDRPPTCPRTPNDYVQMNETESLQSVYPVLSIARAWNWYVVAGMSPGSRTGVRTPGRIWLVHTGAAPPLNPIVGSEFGFGTPIRQLSTASSDPELPSANC